MFSQNEFESVERDLVVRLAGLARRLGCRQFHLGKPKRFPQNNAEKNQINSAVSGLASSPTSRFFVPRVKGEAEEGVRRDGPKSLVIYRPGLLRRAYFEIVLFLLWELTCAKSCVFNSGAIGRTSLARRRPSQGGFLTLWTWG